MVRFVVFLFLVSGGAVLVGARTGSSLSAPQMNGDSGKDASAKVPVFHRSWGGDSIINNPEAVAVGADGTIYVIDMINQIAAITPGERTVSRWGETGSGDGQFDMPQGVAVDSDGYIYVVDTRNYRIQKFTANGNYITQWGEYGSGAGQFGWPTDIAVDDGGNVYVLDNGGYMGFTARIQKFAADGTFLTQWGGA